MAQTTIAIDYDRLPEHMRGGMRRYIENGIPPGGFAMAVLTNDLATAFRHADPKNRAAMDEWVRFLVNEVPARAWGSREQVEEWMEHDGLSGL